MGLLPVGGVAHQEPCLSSDTRAEWPASRHGMSWGGKPTDKGANLRASSEERTRALCPMLTRETCAYSVVKPKWRNWLRRHNQNGAVVAATCVPVWRTASVFHPAESRRRRGARTAPVGIRELPSRCTQHWGAKMPAHGQEDGGGVVAKCLPVMVRTGRRSARGS